MRIVCDSPRSSQENIAYSVSLANGTIHMGKHVDHYRAVDMPYMWKETYAGERTAARWHDFSHGVIPVPEECPSPAPEGTSDGLAPLSGLLAHHETTMQEAMDFHHSQAILEGK